MLSTILREHTRKPHLELESVFIDKIKKIKTVEDYASTLITFYGFFYPLENKISGFIDDSFLPDYNRRRKTVWLKNDIDALANIDDIPVSTDQLPVIDNANKALGALYVMEGSTLGGNVIRKMIQSKVELDSDNGLRFFSSYGANIGAMWENFRNFLNALELTDNEKAEVAEAAYNTFTGFRKWIEHE